MLLLPIESMGHVGLTAPDTTLTSTPDNPSSPGRARFTFTSSEGARFECSLDGAAFSPCVSPALYADLAVGPHVFQVRAIDSAGTVDETPASHDWLVLPPGPDTRIYSTPLPVSFWRVATFKFAGEYAGARFECSLNDEAFHPCTSPVIYDNLPDNAYTFRVHAYDKRGLRDMTPASYSWLVDLTTVRAPVITTPFLGATLDGPTPVFSGTARPGLTISVFVDLKPAGSTTVNEAGIWSLTSELSLEREGPHVVTAHAFEGLGLGPGSLALSFNLKLPPEEPAELDDLEALEEAVGCSAGPGDATWLLAGLALLAGTFRRRRPAGD
ncbi:MYXO-CTERM sorting domain-containing protein [Corallococcus aberystwythensis]|uniref:MYXO-CTERM sorting domain-containing protein n=1 Tax=Corallococcus aberystwythensis TaxID=2316722 RepID=UPI0013159051|nr:MYXO-CTERM sorting domain-containing protein [Corallococcus aberystwythensis]